MLGHFLEFIKISKQVRPPSRVMSPVAQESATRQPSRFLSHWEVFVVYLLLWQVKPGSYYQLTMVRAGEEKRIETLGRCRGAS